MLLKVNIILLGDRCNLENTTKHNNFATQNSNILEFRADQTAHECE